MRSREGALGVSPVERGEMSAQGEPEVVLRPSAPKGFVSGKRRVVLTCCRNVLVPSVLAASAPRSISGKWLRRAAGCESTRIRAGMGLCLIASVGEDGIAKSRTGCDG